MRTTEERVAAMQTRVVELKRRDRAIKGTVTGLALVLVLSVAAFTNGAFRRPSVERASPPETLAAVQSTPSSEAVAAARKTPAPETKTDVPADLEDIADAAVPLAEFASAPEDVSYSRGVLTWSAVDGSEWYLVQIGDQEYLVDSCTLKLKIRAGTEITVSAGIGVNAGPSAHFVVP